MIRWPALLFSLAVAAFLLSDGRTHAAEPAKDRCVILISIDGLAGFYLDDPRAELPTIRKLASEGARAAGTVCAFPTVTWPNHTTLVTGVSPALHGVIGNDYLDRNSGSKVPFIPDPLFDKDEIVKVPTVYDVAHRAGLVTAGIIWPATRNARTLDWTVPDMAGDDAWPKYATPEWLAELRRDGVPVDKHGTWVKESSGGVQRDWLYTRLAAHLLENHPPNLLLIHLIEVDHVQHKFGPQSPEAYWAISYADDRVRDVVEAAGRSRYADKTTIIIASDHGFFPIEKDIRPNVVAAALGFRQDGAKQVECLPQGGSCGVYVLDENDRGRIVETLQTELAKIEGVQAVISPEGFDAIGQPTPDDDSRAADLWLAAESGYAFSASDSGDEPVVARSSRAGTHGYLPDQPEMLGSLILSGYGIRAGVNVGKVSSRDVAPTIATLLGVELETAEGRAIDAALAEE